MKPRKKNRKKKIIIIVGISAVVLLAGGIGFFVFRGRSIRAMAGAATTADAVSTTAETGNISTTVIGTGNLASDTANDIKVPAGIKIKEVLVESGDKVKTGDVLATLDEASLVEALADVQEQLEEIDEEINEVKDDTASSYIKTYVSGRVKKIYAETDKTVNTTMSENGALILMSIDGKMAVSLDDASGVAEGDTVTVTLSDGETVEGTVGSVNGSSCIITMTDNGPELDESVTVSDEDGKELGSGQLYIHQQLEITGSGGTVSKIYVEENQKVSAEKSLIKLKDVPASAEFQKLLAQRSQLTEELTSLTNLASVNAITATFDGTIQTVNVSDDSTVEKSSSTSGTSTGSGMTTSSAVSENEDVLVNASATISKQSVFTFTSASTSESQDETESDELKTSENKAEKSSETDITDENSQDEDDSTQKQTESTQKITKFKEEVLSYIAITAPVYGEASGGEIKDNQYYSGDFYWKKGSGSIQTGTVFEAGTQYLAVVTLTAADGYEFSISQGMQAAYGDAAEAVVDSCKENQIQFTISFPATENAETPDSSKQTEAETDTTKGTEASGTDKTGTTESGNSGSSGTSGSGTTTGSTASSSSSTSDTTSSSSIEVETNYVTAFTVSTDENMLLSVNIDELDILSIEKEQKAVVTLDALEGEEFEGELTYISDTASTSGGVTKYSAEITIPKNDSMLAGMNASATITIESKENVILLPADAVQERGNRQFVYTEQDSETGALSGEVEVETGISDGTNVEVTSGLTEGQTVYYNIVVSESTTEEMSGFMMGGMQNGGGMSGGEMPSGGTSRENGGERPSGGSSGQRGE